MSGNDDGVAVQVEQEGKRQRVRLVRDTDAPNPRTECDNLWTLICSSRSGIGDQRPNSQEAHNSVLHAIDPDPDQRVAVPIYMYRHSDTHISLQPFSDPWDSAQVGVAVVSRRTLAKEGLDEETGRRALQGEIDAYDQFLSDNVFGFFIEEQPREADPETDAWEHVDSCFGFYGARPETNGMLEYWPPALAEAYTRSQAPRPARPRSR